MQIVTLSGGNAMHVIVATTAAAGLAGVMLASVPASSATEDSVRPEVVPGATAPMIAPRAPTSAT